MGAGEHVEGLLKIAVVRERPPIAGEQRLVAGMSDGGLLEHGYRLGFLARGAERLAVLQRGVGILGAGTEAFAEKLPTRAEGRQRGLLRFFPPATL